MSDKRTIVIKQLKCLIESLVDTAFNLLSEKTEITDADLAPYHIRRVDFDIEAAPGPESIILFEPLPQWKLDRHSVRATADEESKEYRDYPADPEARQGLPYKPHSCARRIYRYLSRWVSHIPRVGYPRDYPRRSLIHFGLQSDVGWKHIRVPNPYILHSAGWEGRLGFDKGWVARDENEFKRDENGSLYPHLILFIEQRRNGREGTLLYGEVAPLIASMYARSVQRDIPEDRLHPKVQDDILEDDGLDKFLNNPPHSSKIMTWLLARRANSLC